MNRNDFRKMFKSAGPVVLPVIHVLDREQAERNVRVLLNKGAAGCFLINHDFGVEQFLPIIAEVRQKFPSLWLGVNFLATLKLPIHTIHSNNRHLPARVRAFVTFLSERVTE